ncbi:MAG TPA: hypothetical protein VHN17_10230 [Steroidobacteraceae bacterium]|nr:hypothetical protein [Steroidobacteraceae bacterium]
MALVHAWLCACSGSGVGLDSNGQPLSGSSSGGTVPLSADFDSIQANVFTPICSVCHIGATAPQGLMLDAAHSYDLLVGVPSTEVPSVLRVKPGDPANSYIIQKLEGHAAVGGQMPLGETPLPATTIAFIAQWITDGAPAGTSATAMAMATGFRVASVAPENDAVLAVAPAQIVIGFTRELDATRADAAAVRLERIDGAGETASTTAVAIEPSVPAANPRALLLALRTPLTSGQYRIVLSGQPGAALSSLDGELMTAAPTGANGDRIISRFTVAATP